MEKSFQKILTGYNAFRKKYAYGDDSIMQHLSHYGQRPEIMVIACCDSRVDPAVILQCDPGDLFTVRNVANIVPPYEKDEARHGTSAALEYGIRFLKVKHLILLGHSQCGGIEALLKESETMNNDFLSNWISLIKTPLYQYSNPENYAKIALQHSYQNCLSFPWINEKVKQKTLIIHLWFFDINKGEIFFYTDQEKNYISLDFFRNLP